MYNVCRYSKAWYYSDLMPWCACFSKKDLMVFEYMNDLAYYYNSGPGLNINKIFGCPLLQDMLLQFQRIKEDESKPHFLAKFYFGHSTTLFNLLTQLGTHRQDEHITPDNYERMYNRKWRTSFIDPFGSNFVAVFLKCNSGEPFRIMFYHNEMNFNIQKCGGNICSWDLFYNMFKDEINPEICNTDYCEEADAFWSWLGKATVDTEKKPTEENTHNEKETTTIKNQKTDFETTNVDDNNNNNKLQDHTGRTNKKTSLETLVGTTKLIKEIDKLYTSKKEIKTSTGDVLETQNKLFVFMKDKFDNISRPMNDLKTNTNFLNKNHIELYYVSYFIITVFIFLFILHLVKRFRCRRKYNLLVS